MLYSDKTNVPVKGKIIIAEKVKVVRVAEVFPDFGADILTAQILATPYDGSRKLLTDITTAIAANAAKEAAFATDSPTASYVTKAQKAHAVAWWMYLTEKIVGGPDADDKVLHKALDLAVKQTFDAVFHKMLTGKDLPPNKDGYARNPMQVLRMATDHGDASIFLYKLMYWWKRASIVIDGKKWIAKTHVQWAEELGMSARSFRTAYDHVVKLGLIKARPAKFNGVTINHLRPTEAGEKLFASIGKGPTD